MAIQVQVGENKQGRTRTADSPTAARASRIVRSSARCGLLFGLISAAPAFAQTPVPVPELLADINTQPASEMGDVEFFPGSLPDGRALFSATTIDEGNEVWVTDGTIAGTHMVAGFFPGPEGVEPENAVLADGVYYFHSLSRADTLWQTDGDTLAPVAGYDGSLVPAWDGNQLIGLAGPDSRELDSVFFLDGGQLTQFPIAPGQVFESRFPTARASGGIIFYASAGGLGDRALFASNGTSVGTNPLIDPSVIVTPDFVVFGNKVAVITAVSDGYLGIFDATTGAPSSANDSDPPEDASAVIALGDDGVFYSGVTDIGRELCFYDAEQDAHSCFDLNPTGSGLASSADLFLFEDGVCFAGTDGQTGTEPWCYSLSGGFTPLGDLSPGPNSSRPESFVAAEDVLYFTASAGPSAGIIQRFEVGSLGAVPYLDLEPSQTADVARPLRVVDGTLLFQGSSASEWDRDASASNYRPELVFVSFGAREFLGLSAASGTFDELTVEDTSSTPLHIVPFADGVAMVAFRPSEGYELTAVASNGDIHREEVCPGTEGVRPGQPNIYRLRSAGDRVFLAHFGQCSSISEELILWDGALAQQVTLDISSPSSPIIHGMAGDHLIVTKDFNPPPLYAVSATTGVPQLLSETLEIAVFSDPDFRIPRTTETSQWAIFGSSSDDKTYGTDGMQLVELIDSPTEIGVVLEEGPGPDDFTVVRFGRGGQTVYTIEGPSGPAQTQDGPVLSDISRLPIGQPVNGFALFLAEDSEGNPGFYLTFGSEYERIADAGGRARIAGRGQNGWFYTTVSGGRVTQPTFTDLWFIDEFGSQTLLRSFLDRSGRDAWGFINQAVAVQGWLVFSAVTADGHQLWMSNGTPESTFAVPGVLQPTELTVNGNDVYFSAFGPNGKGAELWRIQVPELPLFSDRFEP